MSLRNLSQGAIITNTRHLIGPLRPALLAQPTLAWAPPILDTLLDDLVALEGDPRAAVDDARRRATESDIIFDHLARALFHLCKAAASLALAQGEDARGLRYLDLGQRLLPAGLGTVNLSYIEEAAEADRVEGRLDDGDRALLRATSAFGAPLMTLVERWQEAARALGEADRARTDIEAHVATHRAPAMSRVRKRWMDVVRAMRAAAALLPEAERAPLFRKLDESEARADARVAARRASGAAVDVADVDEVLPLDGSDVRAPDAEADEGVEVAPVVEAPGGVEGDTQPPVRSLPTP